MLCRIALGAALLTTTLAAFAAGPFGAPPQGSPLADETGAQLSNTDIKLLASVRRATAKYHDVDDAVAAGYVAAGECVPEMGTHYVNEAKAIDPSVDPLDPEILLYDGDGHLVGVEYFVFYDGEVDVPAWGGGTCSTASGSIGIRGVPTAPNLFGHDFDGPMLDHGPLAPEGVCHFDYHVWVWRANPLGITAHENPLVSCSAELD